MKNIKVQWIQTAWQSTVDKTLLHYEKLCKQVDEDCDLLLLPELYHTPYFPIVEFPEHFDYAIAPEQSPTAITMIQGICKEKECVGVIPYFEKRATGLYHNSAMIIERDGSIIHHYRKTHIPDDPAFYEKYYFTPGDQGIRAVETSAGKLGVLICWDQWFPEAARLMATQGAEILIYPTAIGWDIHEPEELHHPQQDSWKTIIRSHAIANGCFSIAVNRVGQEQHLKFWGSSIICGPDGTVLEDSKLDDGIFSTVLNIDSMEEHRRMWPFFRDRRVDLYNPLTKIWDDSDD